MCTALTADPEESAGAPATESLAEILFEEMGRLSPGGPEVHNDWRKISGWERRLYINCIERLCEERMLLEAALDMADNDLVSGRPEKGE
jgi:hypothetical protein